jgi:proteic killer suppression protein
MIRSFRHKGLAELWSDDRTARIDMRMHGRILLALEQLNDASLPEHMNATGNRFHALRGYKPTRYTVHVNGPWCITFSFEDGDAYDVDFEQYH